MTWKVVEVTTPMVWFDNVDFHILLGSLLRIQDQHLLIEDQSLLRDKEGVVTTSVIKVVHGDSKRQCQSY